MPNAGAITRNNVALPPVSDSQRYGTDDAASGSVNVAAAPTATAAPMARLRKSSRSSPLASRQRKVAARYATRLSESAPTPSANGVVQPAQTDDVTIPLPLTSTSPEASAASAAPIPNGVMRLATPKIVPMRARNALGAQRLARKANAAPRSEIPTIAMETGTGSASPTTANACGKQVKRSTTAKITQM